MRSSLCRFALQHGHDNSKIKIGFNPKAESYKSKTRNSLPKFNAAKRLELDVRREKERQEKRRKAAEKYDRRRSETRQPYLRTYRSESSNFRSRNPSFYNQGPENGYVASKSKHFTPSGPGQKGPGQYASQGPNDHVPPRSGHYTPKGYLHGRPGPGSVPPKPDAYVPSGPGRHVPPRSSSYTPSGPDRYAPSGPGRYVPPGRDGYPQTRQTSSPEPVKKPKPPVKEVLPFESFKTANALTKYGKLDSKEHSYRAVEIPDHKDPPALAHNLDRVLFNPGVHFLKDQRSKVYNFSPYLEDIISIKDFDFTKIPAYVPSGQDLRLAKVAQEQNKKYVASTSSITGVLSHIHRLLSHNRLPSLMTASKIFKGDTTNFTSTQTQPVQVFLRYNPQTGTHAIDSDKSKSEDIIVSVLGHVLESMLTTNEVDFEKYRKSRKMRVEKTVERDEKVVEESVESQTQKTSEEPVESAETPAEAIEEAVESVETPVDPVEGSAETVETPVEAVEEPIETAQESTETVEEPVETVQESVETIEESAQTIEQPVESVQESIETVGESLKSEQSAEQLTEQPIESERPTEQSIEYIDPTQTAEDKPVNSYHYTECGNFMLRSQLDCIDSRLPGSGVFDLKTRAVCAVRHDMDYTQIHDGSHYLITKLDGYYESFAREWYELIRSVMFKYSLQARIGRMDGIFLAYHNVKRMFGFQYVPLEDMDKIFHTSHLLKGENKATDVSLNGSIQDDLDAKMTKCASLIADTEFKLSFNLLEGILDQILKSHKNPHQSLCLTFHQSDDYMHIFSKPMTEENIASIQKSASEPVLEEGKTYEPGQDPNTIWKHAVQGKNYRCPDLHGYHIEIRSYINGQLIQPFEHPSLENDADSWTVDYKMVELPSVLASVELEKAFKDIDGADSQYTSIPQLERLEEEVEEEMRREALDKLSPPSRLQRTMRELSENGRIQQERENEINDDKRLWFPKEIEYLNR